MTCGQIAISIILNRLASVKMDIKFFYALADDLDWLIN